MSQETTILGISAAITAGIQFVGFLVAYWMQTEKFYDILGGINFLVLGIYSAYDGSFEGENWSDNGRKVSATVIFSVSRSWLLIFLAWRAHGEYVHMWWCHCGCTKITRILVAKYVAKAFEFQIMTK